MKSRPNSGSRKPDSENKPVSLVIIDLDGTLLEGPASSEKLFFLFLREQRQLGGRQLGAYCYFFLRWVWKYGRLTAKKNKAYLAGLQEASLADAARAFVGARLMGRCCPEMLQRITGHRENGDIMVLLTGSLEIIARPVASSLGIPHVQATRCVVERGIFSSKPPLIHPFGPDKEYLGRTIGHELGFGLAAATAYGNDAFDIPLLQAVARPVAVHPDRELRRYALTRGWEILEHTA